MRRCFLERKLSVKPEDDKFASNPTELGHSREIVLKMADWIVPGHGDIYKAKKSRLKKIRKSVSSVKKN